MDRVSLAAAPVGEEGAWRQQQWHNAFEVLFFHTPPQVSGGGQDDLLFFEYMAAHQTSDNPLFVRRKGRALPADLALGGEKAGQVNWCRSTLLNLVLQTTFTLTVAACARASLQLPVLAGEGPAPVDMTRVSKHVFASPTRVTVNLDSSRSGEEQPTSTYPDLCFAVDNFDDAFKSLVLSEPGWCYVVLLVASEGLPLNACYEQLEDAMLGKRGGGRRKPPSGANRVRMKGPGGQGHADVAVTCLAPKDEGHLRPDALPATPAVQPPVRAQAAGRGGLLGRTMQIASKAVVSTAKGIAGALLDEPRGGLVVQYYMRCALMSLSLPVDLLAAQILKLT
ncbi:hypothetical protein WJX72_002314 [[Myrmecia] bisecta]|uniref:Uncharacterized protein n=1 Tax=[Myrmecia] bisecta TaxID=41462 RepID=A0AAW1PWP8_9CHLO